MPDLQVATLSADGFTNSFGIDLGSNVTIPKLPTMSFKEFAYEWSKNAQYFAIYYGNILYFISTSPFAQGLYSKNLAILFYIVSKTPMLRNHYFSGFFLRPKFDILLPKLLTVDVDSWSIDF